LKAFLAQVKELFLKNPADKRQLLSVSKCSRFLVWLILTNLLLFLDREIWFQATHFAPDENQRRGDNQTHRNTCREDWGYNQVAPSETFLKYPSFYFTEHKVFQAELRRQKRRSRKHTAVVEKKIEEPKIKTEEEKKSERDGILIKLCMANPKLSHVIHYHNKITKFGVKLVTWLISTHLTDTPLNMSI